MIEDVLALEFHGPFQLTAGLNSLYESEFVRYEGIYLWTIKDEVKNLNYVHYIGETTSFGKRQKEHLTNIVGLNYLILNAEQARLGKFDTLWNGMWRDKSPTAVSSMLESYQKISREQVLDYISLVNVYFAPTKLESGIRKHIEGCIGWNLREKAKQEMELKKFYPDDNHVGTMSQKLNRKLIVRLPEPIAGIDPEIEV
jgi:hypothetical protein